MPGYETDFYVPDNIIGYTGVLHKNPTVYFLSATHYGHITQVHGVWENVGREVICANGSYEFGNDEQGLVLVERDTVRSMKHTSRSPMILVRSTLPPELTHAIMVHSEKKARQLISGVVEYDVTDENRARQSHPGQQPRSSERKHVQERIVFWWNRARAVGVPSDTRLYALSQAMGVELRQG